MERRKGAGERCAAAAENLMSRISEEEWRRDSGKERGKYYGRSSTESDRRDLKRALNCLFGFADEVQMDAIDVDEETSIFVREWNPDEDSPDAEKDLEELNSTYNASKMHRKRGEKNVQAAMEKANDIADRYGMERPFDTERGARWNAARLAEGYAFIGETYEKAVMNARRAGVEPAPWAGSDAQRDSRTVASFRGSMIAERNRKMTGRQRRLAGLDMREGGRLMDIHVVSSVPSSGNAALESREADVSLLDGRTGRIGTARLAMYEDISAPADGSRQFYVTDREWNRGVGLRTPLVLGRIDDLEVEEKAREGTGRPFSGISGETKEELAAAGWNISLPEKKRHEAIGRALKSGRKSPESIQQYFRICLVNCRGDEGKCRRLESDLAFAKGIRKGKEAVRNAKTDNVYTRRTK